VQVEASLVGSVEVVELLIARSTSARSTASGVLSSWLASAVKRRSAPK
jgi:hypothetical protein